MLQEVIKKEVMEYVEKNQSLKSEIHRCLVTRNGCLPPRNILNGMGPINIRQPRVRDRREGETFSSSILPKYRRRTTSLEQLVPGLVAVGI